MSRASKISAGISNFWLREELLCEERLMRDYGGAGCIRDHSHTKASYLSVVMILRI